MGLISGACQRTWTGRVYVIAAYNLSTQLLLYAHNKKLLLF